MPILSNPRHELFAQALANGQVPEKAYKSAGFQGNRGNACTLKHKSHVSKRVEELIVEKRSLEAKAHVKAVAEVAVSRSDVLRMLVEDREMARAKNQLGPAVRATELLGKELGMFIDRSLRKETDDIFEGLSDGDLRRMVSERAQALADESKGTRH